MMAQDTVSVVVTGVTTDVQVEVQSATASVLAPSNRAGVAIERLTFTGAADTNSWVVVHGSATTNSLTPWWSPPKTSQVLMPHRSIGC